MTMQLQKTPFEATPVHLLQLLCRGGKAFYLPRYQRPYAWTRENLQEFVSDVNGGLRLVIDGGTASKSALTFLGAAIFLPANSRSESIHPAPTRAEAPQDIAIVIDGQQRITTLLMTCVALASELDYLIARLPANPPPMIDGLKRRALELRRSLVVAIGEDRTGEGKNKFSYYPRMIRENDDLWSSNEQQARYRSPIAELLHVALGWVHERSESRWDPAGGKRIKFETTQPKTVNEEFQSCFKHLRELIDGVCSGAPELQSPSPEQLFSQKTFSQILNFGDEDIDLALLHEWRSAPEKARGPRDRAPALARLVLFSEYLRQRVFVTEVVAPDEENAFDLFQALNTRGEPLTAYETFKPVVMERVPRTGEARYQELIAAMERIDDVIAQSGNSDREPLTQQLLIYAAVYEDGQKLGKNIREQRTWLKSALRSDGRVRTSEELIDFVLGIDRVAQAHKIWVGWQRREHREDVLPDRLHEARLAAEFLADAKHTIMLPALTPFLAAINASAPGSDARHQAQEELGAVLCALLAAATIWRLAYGGTEGIDDAIRTLMANGAGISRKACPSPTSDTLSASKVITCLRVLLERGNRSGNNLLDPTTWLALAQEQLLYRKAAKFARLALAAAYDRSVSAQDPVWLLEDSRDRSGMELSNRSHWWQFNYNLEHLVPQSQGEDVPQPILHGLGNLTLVPKWVNSSLSDKPWLRKQRLFKLIAELSESAAQSCLNELKAEDLLESDETTLERITTEGIYQGVAKAIAALPDDLPVSVLENRSRNLLDRAHRRLIQWLPR